MTETEMICKVVYRVQLNGIFMWKMVDRDIPMHKIWPHSTTEEIFGNDFADQGLSTSSPAMKAEYKSLWWVLIMKMSSNKFENSVTD